jgi:hypothetical protein
MPDETQASRGPASRSAGDGPETPDENLEGREALLERVRTLRLWADHLESLLAERTEQVDIWRKRAEERKARIEELRSAGPPPRRGRLRRWSRRRQVSPPADRAGVEPARQPVPGPGEDRPPEPAVPGRGPVHPTVRLAVVAPEQTSLPLLLDRMNVTRISHSASADTVRAMDVLVVVGAEGASMAQDSVATREWLEQGHPTVAVSATLPGRPSVAESALAHFDEGDDLFHARPGVPPAGIDPHLQPTLHRLHGMRPSIWSARLAERTAQGSSSPEKERLAVQSLREFRTTSSARLVGERLLDAAGVVVPVWKREALAVLVSRRADFVVEAVGRMIRQSYRPMRLAVGLHGPASNAEGTVRGLLEASDIPHTVRGFDPSLPQGACLNRLIESAPGDVVMKIDDDDLYSSVFIEDMMAALEYSGAAIVGKAAAFVRLRRGEHVLLRNACYQAVDHVVGPTITAHRSAWEAVRFPHRHERVDSKFLQAARALDLSVMAHHPWDFCVIRHDQGHSWTASDDYFAAAGRVVDIDWGGMQTA